MKQNTLWIILGVVLVVVIIAGVYFSDRADDNKFIRIGILTHQTGFGAVWGEPELKAAMLRINELKNDGAKIDVVVEDCQSDIGKCVSAMNKLTALDKVDAVVGPTWTEWYEPVAAIAEQNKVILISPSGISEKDMGPYTFSLRHPNKNVALTILSFLKDKNVTSVTMVTTQNAFFSSVSDFIGRYANDYDVEIIEHKLSPDDLQLQTVVTKVLHDGSDWVISNLAQTQEPVFVKKLKENGFNSYIISNIGSSFLYDPDLKSLYNGVYYVDYFISPGFAEHYFSVYKSDPAPSSEMAYNAVSLIYSAFAFTGNNRNNRDEMINYLSHLKNFRSFSQTMSFDEKGYASYDSKVYQISVFE